MKNVIYLFIYLHSRKKRMYAITDMNSEKLGRTLFYGVVEVAVHEFEVRISELKMVGYGSL